MSTNIEKNLKKKINRIVPSETIKWSLVSAIIKEYKKRRPEELAGCFEYVKRLKAAAKTDFAEMGGEAGMRHMYEMPNGLKMALEMKFPTIFKGSNLTIFLRKYPQFSVAKRI